MDLRNKRVLVLGLGISGISTSKALDKMGAYILVSDSKTEEELVDFFKETKDIIMEKYLGDKNIPLENIDLIIKSPGIPPRNLILQEAEKRNIEIITDIELAYRIGPSENIVAITGTNGKTTTTALVGEIFKMAKYKTHIGGNIGVGILWDMINAGEDDLFIIEASSFQLNNTLYFKPKVSLITNISPDHLDWHGSLEDYIDAKKKIFKNQDENDYTVLNYDDSRLKDLEGSINSKVIYFSANNILPEGVFVRDEKIIIKTKEKEIDLLDINEIKILGRHNLENALASVAIALAMDVDLDIVKKGLREFKGVEHRIEFVKDIDGISFYNDSKGTNTDSTIKAIESFKGPIILIAGGYDKGTDFDDLIKAFNNKVRDLILLGETKEKIKETAIKYNFNNIHLVTNMKEAVEIGFSLGNKNDTVLLSPACASWGMYKNFEERGKDFKNFVNEIEVK